ncbi:hypothetical protein L596_017225 [Steinernema carpocapsae]|uniref:Uncharacterized protein n=1 Tax=Steinernema carpocapsae TaxID=34508 RepID=A0A4U5N101_STECR|nr:hypothetical protein L596_017225 [Steinernema carpocapsae]
MVHLRFKSFICRHFSSRGALCSFRACPLANLYDLSLRSPLRRSCTLPYLTSCSLASFRMLLWGFLWIFCFTFFFSA